jgi:lipopolysaccharide biosynthesis protein
MKIPKLIAIYYPQFHSIPENDLAWGNGFTDWDNVKSAEALFEGHYQPRIPLNNDYYDLKNHDTIVKQVKLALNYEIDGFCFYHYWFDGKILLNKPVESFLNDKTLNLPFCLSWANETWSKRWIGDTKTVIQLQKHTPNKELWKKHFLYLCDFFEDKRYIKINNKPVFIIYQPLLIADFSKLINYWNELALTKGFNGVYIISTKRHDYMPNEFKNNFNAIMKFQPQEVYNNKLFHGRNRIQTFLSNKFRFMPERIIDYIYIIRSRIQSYKCFDSDLVWDFILGNAYKPIDNFNGDIIESAYVNWDNTPRYKKKATIFSHVEPDVFKYRFSQLCKLAIENNANFLFINAWNEWAEGAYIEPDTKYGYSYLETIKQVKNDLLNIY